LKTYQINLLNGVVLIVIGLWAYLSTTTEMATALVPVAFGGLFLLTIPPFRAGNPLTANILTLLSGLLIIGLSLSLVRSLREQQGLPVLPVVIMLCSTSVAFVYLLRHRRS
jgi:hypothetical protein